MRFSLAVTGLLASTAAAGVAVVDLAADVDVEAGVLAARHGSLVDVDVDANVEADILSRRDLVDVDADVAVDANVLVARHGRGNPSRLSLKADAAVKARVDVATARRAAKGFRCPAGMSYCPWTKSCACPPGQKLEAGSRKCVGKHLTGAWPKPKTDVYASQGVKLDAYCAISPYRIARYSPTHEYCQAGLNTIAFVAAADIALEVAAHVEIDVGATCSVQLKAVVAGLAGLYLESIIDAVVLFNTNAFGHNVARTDIVAHVSLGLLGNVRGVFCAIGLGRCDFDCVSYCTKGCKNYIDVGAEVGANLEGLVGLCILPNILLVVSTAKVIVTIAIDGLLCLVGGLLGGLLRTFNCNCS